jgi:hypothetical protein
MLEESFRRCSFRRRGRAHHGHYRDFVSDSVTDPVLADSHRWVSGRLRQVALAPISSDASISSLRLTRGFRGAGRAWGFPRACRRGPLVSELCPGIASPHLRVDSRRSRFAWSGRHSRDVFPIRASCLARGARELDRWSFGSLAFA